MKKGTAIDAVSSEYSQSASLLAHSVPDSAGEALPRSIGHNRIAASPLTHRLMLFAFEVGDFLDSVKKA